MATRPIESSFDRPVSLPRTEDAKDLNAGVSTAVKRKFDEAGTPETSDEGGLRKRARLEEGPRSVALVAHEYFQLLAPSEELPKENPFQLIEIQAEVAEGKYHAFRIPRFALVSLSSHFKTVLASGMREEKTATMIWRGFRPGSNIHLQAVKFIEDIALQKVSLPPRNEGLTLLKLEETFPEEFDEILTDIALLSSYFEMKGIRSELSEFLVEKFLFDGFIKYFGWALAHQQTELYKSALLSYCDVFQGPYANVYGRLIGLYEADYSDPEEREIAQLFIQECFKEILLFQVESRFNQWNWESACECLIKIFPRFEFSSEVMLALRNYHPVKLSFFPCMETYVRKELSPLPQLDKWPFPERLRRYLALKEIMGTSPPDLRINALRDFLEKQHPDNVYAWKELAKSYQELGDVDAAIGAYSSALALNPRDDVALIGRKGCHDLKKDWDAAIHDVDELLKIFPKQLWVYLEKGKSLFFKGDLEEAVRFFNKLLVSNPYDVDALVYRGAYYGFKKQWRSAFADFDKALESNVNELIALIEESEELKGLISRFIDSALESIPDFEAAKTFQEFLRKK